MTASPGDKLSPTDLVALAKQAGLMPYAIAKNHAQLQAFADLIRKDEREACDALKSTIQCRELIGAHPEYMAGKEMAVSQFSAAIRARTTI